MLFKFNAALLFTTALIASNVLSVASAPILRAHARCLLVDRKREAGLDITNLVQREGPGDIIPAPEDPSAALVAAI
ncbi:hypothetical protein NLI96_g1581 [Meripilus lineatus]|uniref:Uncharacterized protein n=1 Tax=Meripilus lineatus TaxID=2056292 RepID=A0AAD5VAB6_9APHY|nr:hypothetical protein NLI96_g1581 [Physisporinus lineatus]